MFAIGRPSLKDLLNMKIWTARLALTISLLVPLYFAGAALGVKFGLFDWRFGLGVLIVQWGLWVLLGALAIALVALVLAAARAPRRGWALALLALVIPAAGLGYLGWVREKSAAIPPIHDIATNPNDAPAFSARVLSLRSMTPDVNPINSLTEPLSNFPMYQGPRFASIASRSAGELAREAYPDLQTLNAPVTVAAAFAAVQEEARAAGWDIVTAEPEAGVLEATATTFWFGFKDDVAIRIRPAGAGSQIDMRSTSRVGTSDLGANAARIRSFLAAVAARLAP
jgi:fatty-acyl-CoA synthase